MDLPKKTQGSPINEVLPDEHLFMVSTDDSLYGDILLLLRTQKFKP